MRIYVNDMWCDTKRDWGYKSDASFINSIYYQLQVAKGTLREIKHQDTIGDMCSIAEQGLSHMRDIEKSNKK